MISLDSINYQYPKTRNEIIHDFSAEFQRGEIAAITGANGSGKTTITKLMVGMLRPSSGRITIDDVDTAGLDLFEIGQRASYVFQNPRRQMFCATVWGEIAFGLKNKGIYNDEMEKAVCDWMDYFHLTALAQSYPGKLSQGEQQRVMLCAVLALGTDYIILDEPTTGLDVRARYQLGEMLNRIKNERDCGIIMVSHERDFISRYADREVVFP